ncbi:hypothetical protein Nepgr_014675 [Nepenthes gracilis]|uniref:Uncharacterized protein n=1 Tax=Nepenthes gracilis TaxID=150966 RepID=A0AAD3SL82_NEPGR|nr:hypothetical protein Nepgr_014675 [Nepenthes gracilis]
MHSHIALRIQLTQSHSNKNALRQNALQKITIRNQLTQSHSGLRAKHALRLRSHSGLISCISTPADEKTKSHLYSVLLTNTRRTANLVSIKIPLPAARFRGTQGTPESSLRPFRAPEST